jgi:hypothetical protein
MAKKANPATPVKSLSNPARTQGRAIQWGDLTKDARGRVSGQINDLGRNMQANVRRRLDVLHGPNPPAKAEKEAKTLSDIQPHVRNRAVNVSGAADRRVEHYDRAIHDAQARGESAPAGAGWYFKHHGDIASVAHDTGFHPDHAIVASAVMSPQNSPENEKAAVSELMRAHTHGKVEMTQDLANRLSKKKVPVNPMHIGRTVGMHELHPDTMAALSDTKIRDHAQTNVDLKQISRGGTKANVSKAISVLRGHIHPDEALNPHSAPKVWSYARNIRQSVPGSPEHHEYMARIQAHADQATGKDLHGQGMLDLWGLRHSTEGQLSPSGHTAEDTWMNSITHGQPNVSVGEKGRTNVMKSAASNQSLGYTSNTPLHHAFNNRATGTAAQRLSRGHDFAMPSTAVQEVSWTQARREANKDPEFNQANAAASKAERKGGLSSAQFGTQGDLFAQDSAPKAPKRDSSEGNEWAAQAQQKAKRTKDFRARVHGPAAVEQHRTREAAFLDTARRHSSGRVVFPGDGGYHDKLPKV